MFRLLYIILSLALTQSAIAAQCGPDLATASPSAPAGPVDVAEVFRAAFMGPIHLPGQCGRNVKHLMVNFIENGVDVSNAKAVFLLHEVQQYAGGPWLPAMLTPSRARGYQKAWDFHVVMEMNGLIYDLDGAAKPMKAKEYFEYMFPGDARLDRIPVRVIPSADYLRAFEEYNRNRDIRKPFDENYVVGDYRPMNLPGYPPVTARAWLQSFK